MSLSANDARRVLLAVEYDGTELHGWQRQPGQATIQGELESAISRELGETDEVVGASRTDAGVHACGQAACFVTSTSIPIEKLPFVLNRSLPAAIRVRSAQAVNAAFQPRFAARAKVYRYSFFCGRIDSAFVGRFATRIPRRPDVTAIREAARLIEGEHDFRCFQNASKQPPETTVREMYGTDVIEDGPFVHILILGSGFLFNMVRNIAGTLLDVGEGRRAAQDMRRIIASRDRREAGPTAPARGLCLVRVLFRWPAPELNAYGRFTDPFFSPQSGESFALETGEPPAGLT